MIKHAWPLVVMWYGEMETSDTMIAIQMVEDLVTPSILENNIKRWISSFNFNPFNLQKKGNQEGVFLWNLFLNNEYTDDKSGSPTHLCQHKMVGEPNYKTYFCRHHQLTHWEFANPYCSNVTQSFRWTNILRLLQICFDDGGCVLCKGCTGGRGLATLRMCRCQKESLREMQSSQEPEPQWLASLDVTEFLSCIHYTTRQSHRLYATIPPLRPMSMIGCPNIFYSLLAQWSLLFDISVSHTCACHELIIWAANQRLRWLTEQVRGYLWLQVHKAELGLGVWDVEVDVGGLVLVVLCGDM